MPATFAERTTVVVPDGTSMGLYVARPDGPGPFPVLVVFQEIFGVNAHIRSVADRFGREGYLAVAPDVFHRSQAWFEGSYTDIQPSFALAEKVTDAGLEADLRAVAEWAKADSRADAGRMGCVGFCRGGRYAFLADCLLPFRAAISFYGGGIHPLLTPRASQLHGPVLFFWGGKDSMIDAAQRRVVCDALDAAGKPYVSAEFAMADHGFFCDARASYHLAAARQAWALSLQFLDTYLRG